MSTPASTEAPKFAPNDSDFAFYRVQLKRFLRSCNSRAFMADLRTGALEEIFKTEARAFPELLARQIGLLVESAKEDWTRASNARIDRERWSHERLADRKTWAVERALSLLGITLTWPGLYPVYHREGFAEELTAQGIPRLLKERAAP
jgi:hypothetical protein